MESSRYFLACSRYIELNPVRAWMVADPGDYAWSSFRANAGARPDRLLTPHSQYLALGSNAASGAAAYRCLFEDALPEALVAEIRAHVRQQKALGTDRCKTWFEARTGRFAGVRPVGRPSSGANCP